MLPHASFGQIQGNLQVGADQGQSLAQISRLAARFQTSLHPGGQLVEVGIDLIQGVVGLQQRDGRLLAHPAYAGDVIGGVAHQGLVIYDLIGPHAQVALHLLGQVILGFGELAARQVHHHPLVDQLQQVAVAGDDLDPQAFLYRLHGDAAEDVIGLVAFQFQARNAKGVHHLADAHHLRAQVVGHFFPGSLVRREILVAEGVAPVEGYSQIIRLLLFQQAQQHAGEAKHPRGGLAIRSRKARTAACREGKEGAVCQGVSVD